jgi:kinesin family member 5
MEPVADGQVVELEISLDEIREQYNNVLKANNNRSQQKKMAFLERNLEQLTNVQRGVLPLPKTPHNHLTLPFRVLTVGKLVEQNSTLKKEVAIAERKLAARNERIESLEQLLHDAQESLSSQNHKFEQQLALVRERLEAARIQRASGASAPGITGVGGFLQGRIAKPLRGGGGAENVNSQPVKG